MIAIIAEHISPSGDYQDEAVATFDDNQRELAERIMAQFVATKHDNEHFSIQPYVESPPPPHNPESMDAINEYWSEAAQAFLEAFDDNKTA